MSYGPISAAPRSRTASVNNCRHRCHCGRWARRRDSRTWQRCRVLWYPIHDPGSVCCWHSPTARSRSLYWGRRRRHCLRHWGHHRRARRTRCWEVCSGSRPLRIGSHPNQFNGSDCFLCQADKGEGRGPVKTYFAILGQIDLERFRVVLETQRGHGKKDILAVDRLALLLLALFRRCATSAKKRGVDRRAPYLRW